MEYVIALLVIINMILVWYMATQTNTTIFNVLIKIYNLKKQIQEVRRYVGEEHKITRKETQELKTRATQDRKDLNDIQKKVRKIK